MYNLSHIYIYEEKDENSLNKSIKLLIQSFKNGFYQSIELLCLVIIKKIGFDIEKIKQELHENFDIEDKLYNSIYGIIKNKKLLNPYYFEKNFKYYKDTDYTYYYNLKPIKSSEVFNLEENSFFEERKNISQQFYEGFDLDI